MSEYCLTAHDQLSSYIMARKLYFDEMMMMLSALHKTNILDLCSASSLKQQFAGAHVAPLEHIMLILSQSVFA